MDFSSSSSYSVVLIQAELIHETTYISIINACNLMNKLTRLMNFSRN